MPIHFGRRQQQQLAGWLDGWMAGRLTGWLAGWLAGWLTGWLVDWQDNNRDQTHLKCRAKGERQNAHLNFMDELQQMEHCAACQKLLPKSVGCQDVRMRGWAAARLGPSRMPDDDDEDDDDAPYTRWLWRRESDGWCHGSRGRPAVLPTWCSLQSIEVNAATSCFLPFFLSLALTLSLSLPLSLSRSSFTLSLLFCFVFSLCFRATPFSWKGKK